MASGTTGAPGNIPYPVGSDQYALTSDLAGMASQMNLALANAGGPSDPRPPLTHGHVISDVQNLASTLAGKVGTNDARLTDARTPKAHQHPVGDVTGLADRLEALEGPMVTQISTGIYGVGDRHVTTISTGIYQIGA